MAKCTKKYIRGADELTKKEIEILRSALKSDDDIKVKFVDEFMDDHIECASVEINEVKMCFWWAGPEIVGALKYSTDPKAQKVVRNAIEYAIEWWEEENAQS